MQDTPITREDLLKEIDELEAAKYELELSYEHWRERHNLLYMALENIASAKKTSASWETILEAELAAFSAYKKGEIKSKGR